MDCSSSFTHIQNISKHFMLNSLIFEKYRFDLDTPHNMFIWISLIPERLRVFMMRKLFQDGLGNR